MTELKVILVDDIIKNKEGKSLDVDNLDSLQYNLFIDGEQLKMVRWRVTRKEIMEEIQSYENITPINKIYISLNKGQGKQ